MGLIKRRASLCWFGASVVLALSAACDGERKDLAGLQGLMEGANSTSGDQLGWVRYQNLPIEGCDRRVLAGAARLPNVVYVTPLALVGSDARFAQDIRLRAPAPNQAGSLSFTIYFPDLELGEQIARGEVVPPEHVRTLVKPGCSRERIKERLNALREQSSSIARLLPEPITHVESLPVSAIGVKLGGAFSSEPVYFGTPGASGDLTYMSRAFSVVLPVPSIERYHDLADMLQNSSAGLPVEVSFNFSARVNGEWISVTVSREQLLQSVRGLLGSSFTNGAGAGFVVDGVTIDARTQYVTESEFRALLKQAMLNIGVNVRAENGAQADSRYNALINQVIAQLIAEDATLLEPREDSFSALGPQTLKRDSLKREPLSFSDAGDSDLPAPPEPRSGDLGVAARSNFRFKLQVALERLQSGRNFSMTVDNTEAASGASVSVPAELRYRRSESSRRQLSLPSSLDVYGRQAPWETLIADLRAPISLRIWPERVVHEDLVTKTDRHYLSRGEIEHKLSTYTDVFPYLRHYNSYLSDWTFNGQTIGWIWESSLIPRMFGATRFRVWGYEETTSSWDLRSVREVNATPDVFSDLPLVVGFGDGGASVPLSSLLTDDLAGRWKGSYDAVSQALVVSFDPARIPMVQMRSTLTAETTTYWQTLYFEEMWKGKTRTGGPWYAEKKHNIAATEAKERTTWYLNIVEQQNSLTVEGQAQVTNPAASK